MPTNVDIPALGESVSEAVLVKWLKADGEYVNTADPVAELETDKANVDLPAPVAGVLRRAATEGATVKIGQTIAKIEEGAAPPKPAPSSPSPVGKGQGEGVSQVKAASPAKSVAVNDLSPAPRRIVTENKLDPATITGTGPGGRVTKEDASGAALAKTQAPPAGAPARPAVVSAPPTPARPASAPSAEEAAIPWDASGNKRVPMSKIRKKIAERLLSAQQNAAILTTFNEVDLTEVMAVRARYKEKFEKTHGIGLGLMSFFSRATVAALQAFPKVNAEISGDDVVYHNYVHLGIAVSTERGLVVPVLRHAEQMSFAKIEGEIKRLALAARDGKLGLEELSGGTFTITNGGVFGSLLSTPILNPPQSGILGMHTIQKRPMAIGDEIKIRQMMYIALSYDHRVVDGKDSVSFLVRIKELLEDPSRLLLDI
jgi:2-oxoglutarate dehydrogenase E2 component (dihydrolipoamide succinyltransferase)